MLNFKTDVNRAEWLNLVFENRNQSYGAYQLRKESGNYLMKALMISGILFSGAIVISSISNHLTKVDVIKPTIIDPISPDIITIDVVEKPKVAPPKGEAKFKQEVQPLEDLKQVNLTNNIRPVENTQNEIPTIEEVKTSIIGNVTISGASSIDENVSANFGTLEGNSADSNYGNEIVGTELLEAMPEFPGGMAAWSKFLTRNLNYPIMARDNNIDGRVMVSFIVEKDGQISNLKVLKGIGGGCDEEAMRVIKKSPFWKPGIQNGKPVRVAYIMPIVFRLD